MVLHADHEGMQVDFAPTAGEGKLARRRQVLVAEEDHLVFQQGGADFAQHLVGQVFRKVDAGDLGAERAGDLVRLDMAILRIPHDVHLVASSVTLGGAWWLVPAGASARSSMTGIVTPIRAMGRCRSE